MELVENPYLSDFTKNTLSQFRWTAGDPIPADLGELLTKLKADAPASSRIDVLVDVALLSPESVEEVNAMLDAGRVEMAKRKKASVIDPDTVNMTPSVRAAYEQFAKPTIIDDRETATDPPPAPAPVAAPEPAPEPVTPEVNPLAPQEYSGGTEPMVLLPFCPRCGWDMRQKYDVDVTTTDKEDFVATLLGNTRFKRKYELLGGRLCITMRSLLAEESKMIYRQLVADQQANRVTNQTEWFTQMLEYRLACSLESTADKSGRLLQVVPELSEMPKPANADVLDTPVLSLYEFVNTKVLAQEVLKRMVGAHLREFQRLVEALEAMALEPSFWNGIE